ILDQEFSEFRWLSAILRSQHMIEGRTGKANTVTLYVIFRHDILNYAFYEYDFLKLHTNTLQKMITIDTISYNTLIRDLGLKGRGPSCFCSVYYYYYYYYCFFLSFSVRDFKLEFFPLNMLSTSPKLARMSGLAKNFIK
ncbi:hypothetical protein P3392_23660, partial [Vibrio parahaemolyticus]|nr:hypothetical protein [Vibrio parahaemolyticus]